MKVGLTFDLKDHYLALGFSEEQAAEFDQPETIDALEAEIQSFGFETERIGPAFSLIKLLSAGQRWDLVFNIAEGASGLGREALVPALLDAYNIPYTFSDPVVMGLTLHKGLTKHAVRDLGIPTPDFALIETIDDLDLISLPFPLFVKPVGEGTGKGISAASYVTTKMELQAVSKALLEKFKQPVIAERYLSGRELTAGIVGTGKTARVIGVMEAIFHETAEHHGYSYSNKKHYEDRVSYQLCGADPLYSRCKEIALGVWRGLHCCDAGRVDLRTDAADNPYFLEVNPLAGLNPVHSDLPILCRLAGISFSSLIEQIMRSACTRCNLPFPGA